jgi:hypothetical protein
MKKEKYIEQQKRLPQNGQQIIGQKEAEDIIVYQAYNNDIANFAIQYQKLGGEHYSYNRMSWIKPGFLWMMHRAGWGTKENQERILAITIKLDDFKKILQEATISSYKKELFATEELWKQELEKTEVRLQWDPDHDPYGNKQERKAIQIGMKGNILKQFGKEWVKKIEDITGFAQQEYEKVKRKELDALVIPFEDIIHLSNEIIEKRIGISI